MLLSLASAGYCGLIVDCWLLVACCVECFVWVVWLLVSWLLLVVVCVGCCWLLLVLIGCLLAGCCCWLVAVGGSWLSVSW